MNTFKPFTCGTCGGNVQLAKKTGRTHQYRRGVVLPVPASFEIPTCTGCGEEYLSVERAEALHEALRPQYAMLQSKHCRAVVERIQSEHGVTLRYIENICAVTPTYLSHILNGRKEASDTLVYLLEAYSLAPAEFKRRTKGVSWEDAARDASPAYTLSSPHLVYLTLESGEAEAGRAPELAAFTYTVGDAPQIVETVGHSAEPAAVVELAA